MQAQGETGFDTGSDGTSLVLGEGGNGEGRSNRLDSGAAIAAIGWTIAAIGCNQLDSGAAIARFTG